MKEVGTKITSAVCENTSQINDGPRELNAVTSPTYFIFYILHKDSTKMTELYTIRTRIRAPARLCTHTCLWICIYTWTMNREIKVPLKIVSMQG